jgi:hypothetical protein
MSRLKGLAQLEMGEWNENLFKRLQGDCDGLAEIRFKGDGVQQRPLGFRSDKHEFTILFSAKEKGGKFVPKSACEIALRRKNEILNDGRQTNALWLALE